MNAKYFAECLFIYTGEERNLPNGGQRMFPRLPVKERELIRFDNVGDALTALLTRVEELDATAEEVHQEAVRGSKARMSSFEEELVSDKNSVLDKWLDNVTSAVDEHDAHAKTRTSMTFGNVKCNWTGWQKTNDRLSTEYEILGVTSDGQATTLEISLDIKRGWFSDRVAVNIFVNDVLCTEGSLVILLRSIDGGENTGLTVVHAAPRKPTGVTLLLDRQDDVKKIVEILSIGMPLEFSLIVPGGSGECICKLPLVNNTGFRDQWKRMVR